MEFHAFSEKFPAIADKETRAIIFLNNNEFGIPKGEYAFVEMFCNDPKCDCRRVYLQVFSGPHNQFVATISWGWGDKAFYEEWMGCDDDDLINSMIGPNLEMLSQQSPIAPQLLKAYMKVLFPDKNFTERVKKHYAMWKSKK